MGPACSGRNIHRDDRGKKIGQPVDADDIEKSIWGIDERKGANSISVETPEMTSKALEELDKHLRGVLSFGDTAIRQAYKQNPDYINDPKFRLAFLRSDRFDAKKASLRMVRHFDVKRKLFGSNVLGRDIRQSDLSDDDVDFLNTGSIMISQYKDRHGRTVGVKTLKNMRFKTRQNFVRTMQLRRGMELINCCGMLRFDLQYYWFFLTCLILIAQSTYFKFSIEYGGIYL